MILSVYSRIPDQQQANKQKKSREFLNVVVRWSFVSSLTELFFTSFIKLVNSQITVDSLYGVYKQNDE